MLAAAFLAVSAHAERILQENGHHSIMNN